MRVSSVMRIKTQSRPTPRLHPYGKLKCLAFPQWVSSNHLIAATSLPGGSRSPRARAGLPLHHAPGTAAACTDLVEAPLGHIEDTSSPLLPPFATLIILAMATLPHSIGVTAASSASHDRRAKLALSTQHWVDILCLASLICFEFGHVSLATTPSSVDRWFKVRRCEIGVIATFSRLELGRADVALSVLAEVVGPHRRMGRGSTGSAASSRHVSRCTDGHSQGAIL